MPTFRSFLHIAEKDVKHLKLKPGMADHALQIANRFTASATLRQIVRINTVARKRPFIKFCRVNKRYPFCIKLYKGFCMIQYSEHTGSSLRVEIIGIDHARASFIDRSAV